MLRRLTSRRVSHVRLAAPALVACLVVTACGTNLAPEDVAGRGTAVAVDGSALGPGGDDSLGVPDASGDTSGDLLDGGTGADPGSSDPGTTGTVTTDGGASSPGGSAPKGTDPTAAPGAPPAGTPSGTSAASCDGLQNTTGITDSQITIANASDISGPVPGLFESARQGTQAFVSYYNSTTTLCGRSLKLLPLDSRADAGADQQAYATACDQSFAAVGSVSSFDLGGAATAQKCGLPDIRSATVTPQRQACTTCFAAYTVSTSSISSSIPKYWLKAEPQASRHVAIFYVNVSAAKVNAEAFAKAYERGGMNVDVLQPIDTSEFNYATYAQQMKDNDIEFVQYFGPYQFAIKLQQAMKQQSFVPKVYFQDPTIYDDNYLEQAGDLADGVYVFTTNELFDDTSIREMALYRSWLEQVAPGAIPNYYGLYAWSAARLFVEQATALGGDLTRASLVAAMRQVKGWNGKGLHAPMEVGRKTTSPCTKIIQYDGSRWRSVSGADFTCAPLIQT